MNGNMRRQAVGMTGHGNRPEVVGSRTAPLIKPSELARASLTRIVPLVGAAQAAPKPVDDKSGGGGRVRPA